MLATPEEIAKGTRIVARRDPAMARLIKRAGKMELRDPLSVETWKPDQFWVCNRCGRHFWTTYPPPNRDKLKPAAEPAAKP